MKMMACLSNNRGRVHNLMAEDTSKQAGKSLRCFQIARTTQERGVKEAASGEGQQGCVSLFSHCFCSEPAGDPHRTVRLSLAEKYSTAF